MDACYTRWKDWLLLAEGLVFARGDDFFAGDEFVLAAAPVDMPGGWYAQPSKYE